MVRNNRTFAIITSLLLLVTGILLSCSSPDVAGSEVTNENVIFLTGSVLDRSGNGVSNIEVELAELGFRDTTDLEGNYEISLSSDSAEALGIDLNGKNDTLFVKQQGDIISSYTISTFVDTLPDTYLIQRNVWGKLISESALSPTVEAVITSNSSEERHEVELWLNTLTNEYSGFMYMLKQNGNPEYSIYINVYDSEERFIGRSPVMTFPQSAGDLHFPDFTPDNALPSVSISAVTTAKICDEVAFKADVSDNFGGVAESYLWDFGDGTTATTEEVTHAFLEEKDHTVYLTIIDNDNNRAETSFVITITNDDAVIAGLEDITSTINDEVNLSVDVTDENGIQKIIWDFGDETGLDSTVGSSSSEVSHIFPQISESDTTFPITVIAIDSFGDSTIVTKNVTLLINAPEVTKQENLFVANGAVVKISPTANDKNEGGFIDTYLWDMDSDGVWDDSGSTKEIIKNGTGGERTIIWGARDDDGIITSDTFSITFNRAPVIQKIDDLVYYSKISWGATDEETHLDPEPIQYSVKLGVDNLQEVYRGEKSELLIDLERNRIYNYSITARDKFDSSTVNGTFSTERDPNTPQGMTLILSKGKSFEMGSDEWPDDGFGGGMGNAKNTPAHEVTFTYDFYMDTTEVVQYEYERLMGENPSKKIGDSLPVENLQFSFAVLYCNARSKEEGKDTVYSYTKVDKFWKISGIKTDMSKNGYRLPTEAEWEYACRAHSKGRNYWEEDQAEDYGWFLSNSNNTTHKVAAKKPNLFGLYDMNGNVAEWCNDEAHDYSPEPQTDPSFDEHSGYYIIYRGGSFNNEFISSTTRSIIDGTYMFNGLGFRTVCKK